MQLIEDILPVEYYHQLAGVMVDSAIILEKVEKTSTSLYKFMKEKGFDIFLNNLIFKFLMTLFTENTHPSIYLSVIDCLLVSGQIILHRACLLYLSFIREDIFKCNDLGECNTLFDSRLKEIDNNKFSADLIRSDFGINMDEIEKQRKEKLPKIIESIKLKKYIDFFQRYNVDYRIIAWDRLGNSVKLPKTIYCPARSKYNQGGIGAIKDRLIWMWFILKTLFAIKDDLKIHACDLDAVFPAAIYKAISSKNNFLY